MKISQFGLLTDENIDPEVVVYLRTCGFDVRDVSESGLKGAPDATLLRRAFVENRVVVTHDADFGKLAILGGEPVVGILYLRPGHIDARFTVETIDAVLAANLDVGPRFVLAAKRVGTSISIRVRNIERS